MRERLRERWSALARRVRRFERRELREFRAWIERTSNLVHLSALLFVPLLVALVTYLANAVSVVSFLLFPPLASGTYTLFADPRGKYASPTRFVAGLTVGAACGGAAVGLSAALGQPTAVGQVAPGVATGVSVLGAAVAVFLVGGVTWLFDVEEPAAFSTALLALLVPPDAQAAFVGSVGVSSLLVAGVFAVWRSHFYEQRAEILYQSTSGDDHVLVPMRGDRPEATAMLAAEIAGAHDAGKVVLLDVVADAAAARAERALLDDRADVTLALAEADDLDRLPSGADSVDGSPGSSPAAASGDPEAAVAETARTLEERAAEIEASADVPCEVVVAVDGETLGPTLRRTAEAANCDLIAVPHAGPNGGVPPFVRSLFASDVDVLVHRSADGRTGWRRIMVPVRRTGHVAHSMLDFALRLAGADGSISVCNCIGPSGDRRRADEMLEDLVEPFTGPVETRVASATVEAFLADHATEYDLVFVGASQDRSAASRLVSPPTFERLDGVDTDLAIVDRG